MLSTVRSFDLVLLEEGEEYVTDAACTLSTSFPNQSTFNTNSTYNNNLAGGNTSSSNRNNVENAYNKGRIRIGTKSLIFEPDSLDMPLLKLQFQHITLIQHHNNSCAGNNVNNMNNGVNVDENGILVCSKQVTSIPTSIYNGKSRFITPYTTYTINNSTNNITSLGNIRDAGPGRLELENSSCYTFLFIYSTPEIQKQQFIIFNSLLNSTQNSIPVPNTIHYGTGVIGVSMGIIPNREKLILGVGKESVYCWRLKRMVRHGGYCALTDRALYFQPSPNFSRKLFKRINLDSVLHIFKRDSGLTSTGECLTALEVVSLPEEITDKIKRKQYRCIYLEFKQGSDRDKLVNALKDIVPKAFFAIDSRGFRNEMTELWRMGLLPNFQYLDFLNCIAGRSRYDISHYPVFPWVLTDYSSTSLDLNNQNVYRDLSKPIGSLNIERLHLIKKRMYNLFLSNSVSNMDKGSDGNLKNRDTAGKNVSGNKSVKSGDEDLWDMGYYIYGSHYSTPALIVFFLIRLLPECQLRLYGGRFDSSSRTFNNIQHTYENVMNGHSSFFELIPEFYESDELFLKNSLNITTQDGRLGDVELPKWAHNSPTQFLKIMRSALESDYVSKNLTNWIDLIFGYKQSGQNSIVNNNTYHPLTYLGSVHAGKLRTTSAIQNLLKNMDSHAISVQVREFGQSPILLFDTPHPRKLVFNKFDVDDVYYSSPWFIYVEKHSELFSKSIFSRPAESAESLRLNRTILPTHAGGHLNQLTELHESNKLKSIDLEIADKLNNLGFLPQNFYYILTSGSIQFNHFSTNEREETTNNSSSDEEMSRLSLSVCRETLMCGTEVGNLLFTCDSSGHLHIIDYNLLLNADEDAQEELFQSHMFVPKNSTNLDRGRHFTAFKLHEDGIMCIDNEGDNVVTGSLDETVRLFQITNTDLREMKIFDESSPIVSLCFRNDLLLAGVMSGSLSLYDVRTPNSPIWSFEPTTERVILSCGISNHFIQAVSKCLDPILFWDIRMLNSLGSCDSFMKQIQTNVLPLSSYSDLADFISITYNSDVGAMGSKLEMYDLNKRIRIVSMGLNLTNPTMTRVNTNSDDQIKAIIANNKGQSIALYS